MIVLADADVDRAANTAVYYGMLNSGQTCISVERVYVEAPVYDEFVAKVTEKARALRQGTASRLRRRRVDDVPAAGRHRRAPRRGRQGQGRARRGRRLARPPDNGGYWYEPTVLVDVNHTMLAMTEETFGPTLPIMKVRDEEEAIKLANDSPYGLGASVFGKDIGHAEAVARRIDAGAVCVNDALVNYSALELPMGGAKARASARATAPAASASTASSRPILVTPFALRRTRTCTPTTPR